MNINIVCVGKIKEKYIVDGIAEYNQKHVEEEPYDRQLEYVLDFLEENFMPVSSGLCVMPVWGKT